MLKSTKNIQIYLWLKPSPLPLGDHPFLFTSKEVKKGVLHDIQTSKLCLCSPSSQIMCASSLRNNDRFNHVHHHHWCQCLHATSVLHQSSGYLPVGQLCICLPLCDWVCSCELPIHSARTKREKTQRSGEISQCLFNTVPSYFSSPLLVHMNKITEIVHNCSYFDM